MLIIPLFGALLCFLPAMILSRNLIGDSLLNSSTLQHSVTANVSIFLMLLLELFCDYNVMKKGVRKYHIVSLQLSIIIPNFLILAIMSTVNTSVLLPPIFAARMIFLFNGNVSLIRLYSGKNIKASQANVILLIFCTSQILLCTQCQLEHDLLVIRIIRYACQIFCFCFIIIWNFRQLKLLCYDFKKLSFDKYCLFIHLMAFIIFFAFIWIMDIFFGFNSWKDLNLDFLVIYSYFLLILTTVIILLDCSENRRGFHENKVYNNSFVIFIIFYIFSPFLFF